MKKSFIDWENISNAKIKENLTVLLHEHTVVKDKLLKLTEKLEEIEDDYYYGNLILSKRLKGEE
jgi:CDP-glycerol glycerophosphotransferase (TagB/SpsB family)